MKNPSLLALVVVSALATACAFENTSNLLIPTSPGANGGTASTSTSGSTSTGAATPASAFTGAWGSSSIAGLPIGNCTDLKWLITEQSATTIGGTVSATCSGGATVSAMLTGQMNNETTMNLTANGTIMAMGIPCAFNLTGVGIRQPNNAMKLDYQGSYCLGTLSGSEMLNRFPSVS